MKRRVLILLSILLTPTPGFAQQVDQATASGFSFAALRMQKAGFPVISIAGEDEKGPVINSVVRDADGVIVELVELRTP